MIKIKKVVINNFKVFQGKHTFSFDEFEDGIHLISGENCEDTLLGSNGSGKSTIIEALCWCWYGKTSTNLSASNLLSWNLKKGSYSVESVVEKDNKELIIYRQWNPNSLLFVTDTEKSEKKQEDIDNYLGMNFEDFCSTILISFNNLDQLKSKFIDMKPSERLKVFSDVLGLTKWINFSDTAKTLSKSYQDKHSNLQIKKAKIAGNINAIKNISYLNDIKKFELNKKQNLISLKKQIEEINLKIDTIEKENKRSDDKEIFAKREELKKVKDQIKQLNNAISEYRNTGLHSHQTSLIRCEEQIRQSQKAIDSYSGLGNKCNTCGQEITKQVKASLSVEQKRKIKALEEKADKFRQMCNEEVERINSSEVELKKVRDKEIKLRSVILQFENENEGKDDLLKELTLNKKRLIEKYKEIKEQDNPYKKREIQNRKKLSQLNDKLSVLDTKENKLTKRINNYKIWVEGFKHIRLDIISEALSEFEIVINETISNLGMSSWKVKLVTDYTTKSNNVKKGFEILVESKRNKERVPLKTYSCGESQRIRLAVCIGFSEFISSYKGIETNIEFYDEPSWGISVEGVSHLMSYLRKRAEEKKKVIFVIDHQNLQNCGDFTSHIKVVKQANGISKITE